MNTYLIRGFSDEQQAQTYFDNKVKESNEVQGMLITPKGSVLFRKDSGEYQPLADDEELYLVITAPKGAKLSVDKNNVSED
jgi:hypothetical protein